MRHAKETMQPLCTLAIVLLPIQRDIDARVGARWAVAGELALPYIAGFMPEPAPFS